MKERLAKLLTIHNNAVERSYEVERKLGIDRKKSVLPIIGLKIRNNFIRDEE